MNDFIPGTGRPPFPLQGLHPQKTPLQPLPAQTLPVQGNQPISLLSPDQLFKKLFPPAGNALTSMSLTSDPLDQKMQIALNTAQDEWDKGVKETKGKPNRGKEVDKYAIAVGGIIGETWCGYYLGYCFEQAGLKDTIALASTLRAKNFFRAPGTGRQFVDVADKTDMAKNSYSYDQLPIKPGDVVVFAEGGESHLGMVESYDHRTGMLVTLEGNSGGGTAAKGDGSDTQVVRDGNAVVRKNYNLSLKNMRQKITGFGRPALSDFA